MTAKVLATPRAPANRDRVYDDRKGVRLRSDDRMDKSTITTVPSVMTKRDTQDVTHGIPRAAAAVLWGPAVSNKKGG